MDFEDFRIIPGYSAYEVDKNGSIRNATTFLTLPQYILNGYFIVDAYRGALTETLPVHRAVALAWVVNPEPDRFNIVNHKDGCATNNYWTNLEWTNHSGNNYHAIASGLRSDNIKCRIRDFHTKEVYHFPSIGQAVAFMGLPKESSPVSFLPKQFGRLIAGRYEFRYDGDDTPWFYENREALVPPSRYMVVVTESDGTKREIYSNKAVLKEFQLYDAPGHSMPALVQFGNEKYTDKKFELRDSYSEERYFAKRATAFSIRQPVSAERGEDKLSFTSLSACAAHFNVDRSSIQNRLDNGK